MISNLYFSELKIGIDKGVHYYQVLKIHRNMFSETVEVVLFTDPKAILVNSS